MYSTGYNPFYVAVADLNNDTYLDIIVANGWSSYASVLLGYGDGSFHEQMMFSTGYGPLSVAVGDFNNDTRLDIVVGLRDTETNNVVILFGCDNEMFVKQMTLTTGNGSRPRSVAIGDFNNDNHMDIAVANSETHNIGIFLGYDSMTFSRQETFSTGPSSSPYSVAAGDFNNDIRLDIVVANYLSDNVGIFLGYGNGSFANQVTYSAGSYPYSVAVSDFNNDNQLDIVVANHGTNNLAVFLGHGNGTFANAILFSLSYASGPFSVVVGDFNNDRKPDFAVANDGTDSLSILLQTC
jgi:hypothetical protein